MVLRGDVRRKNEMNFEGKETMMVNGEELVAVELLGDGRFVLPILLVCDTNA